MSRALTQYEYDNPGVPFQEPEWMYYWSDDVGGVFMWVLNGMKTDSVTPVLFSHNIPEHRSTRNLVLLSWIAA